MLGSVSLSGWNISTLILSKEAENRASGPCPIWVLLTLTALLPLSLSHTDP